MPNLLIQVYTQIAQTALHLPPMRACCFFIFILFFTACKEEKAIIPSYILVKPFALKTDNSDPQNYQGDTSQRVLDVWAFTRSNGETFLGSYGLPALIPVLKSGKTIMRLSGGIKRSGQDADRIIFPFYNDYFDTTDLELQKVDTISPVVTYLSGTRFPVVEDFERSLSTFSINKDTLFYYHPGDTLVKISDANAWKPGSPSGLLQLSSASWQMMYESIDVSNLPAYTSPIFVEMDYKCNTSFFVGYKVSTATKAYSGSIIQLGAKGEWNKLYLDITDIIGYEINKNAPEPCTFKIVILMDKNDTPTPEVYLDNIKLLYR